MFKFRNEQPELRYILLDAHGINDMDASGEEALEMLVKRVRSAGLGFAICGLKGQVIEVMERTGLIYKIGKQHIYADNKTAVASLIAQIHDDVDLPGQGCGNCPLTQYIPVVDEGDDLPASRVGAQREVEPVAMRGARKLASVAKN